MVTTKTVPGVRFDPGGEDNPLVWVIHVDGPVRVAAAAAVAGPAHASRPTQLAARRARAARVCDPTPLAALAWAPLFVPTRGVDPRVAMARVRLELRTPPLAQTQDEYVVRGERRKCPYAGRTFPVTLRFPNNYPFKVCCARVPRRGYTRRRTRGQPPSRHAARRARTRRPAPCPPRAIRQAPEMSFAPGMLYHPNVARETGDVCGDIIAKVCGVSEASPG